MFGLFKNNIPEIQHMIMFAIEEEKKHWEKAVDVIIEDIKVNEIIDNLMAYDNNTLKQIYTKQEIKINGISKREMFKALESLSKSATYNRENNFAYGDIGEYNVTVSFDFYNQLCAEAKWNNSLMFVKQTVEENNGKTLF